MQSKFTQYPSEAESKYLSLINSTLDSITGEGHPSFSTKAIHAGQEAEPVHGSINVPIHLSSTFVQKSPGELYSHFDYSRCGNPTRETFDHAIAAVEYAKYGLSFGSGCAAMTCVCMLLTTGDHILCCDDVYGGTQRYLREIAVKKHGLKVDFVDLTDVDKLEKYVLPTSKLIIIETPTNPTLKVCDIAKVCEFAKKHKLISVVDNTFSSPYLQSPLLLGADLCLNSCTKYIGGHCDIIMGTITTNDLELNDRLYFIQKSFGGIPSPFECYLCLRGLKTLKVRMEEHCKNANIIARFLEKHPKIVKVLYPGLESHPGHKIAKKQMRNFGGMITFYLKGDLDAVRRMCKAMKIFVCAESLGGVESLMETPALMTHASVPADVRKSLGIDDNLIRMSIGIENIEDLLDDIEKGLNAV